MTQSNSSEAQWLQWVEVQKAATHLWLADKLPEAIALVARYLQSEPPVDLRRQAIGFQGSLHQEAGNLAQARASFLAARELAEVPDFERSTLEESIAVISLRLGDVAEARRWYWQAIETAASDSRAVNAVTFLRFLEIQTPRRVELELIESLIARSWSSYGLPGTPDFLDLNACIHRLIEAQRKPPNGSP